MSNGKDDISTYDFSMIFNNINKVSEVKDENNVNNSQDNLYNTNLISELDLQNFDPKRYEYYTNLIYIYRKDKKTLYDLLRKYYSIKNLKGKEKKLIRTISNYARLHREADGATETTANKGDDENKDNKPSSELLEIVEKLFDKFKVDETLKGRDFEDKVFFLIMNIFEHLAKDSNVTLTEETIDKLSGYVSEVLENLNPKIGGMERDSVARGDRRRRGSYPLLRLRGEQQSALSKARTDDVYPSEFERGDTERMMAYIHPDVRSLTRNHLWQSNVQSLGRGRELISGDSKSEYDTESTFGDEDDTESTFGDEDDKESTSGDEDDKKSNKKKKLIELKSKLKEIIKKDNLTKYRSTYNNKNSEYINFIEEILLGKNDKSIDEETTVNFINKYKEYNPLKMTGGILGQSDKDITTVVSETMNSFDNTDSGLDKLINGIVEMQKKKDPIQEVVPIINKQHHIAASGPENKKEESTIKDGTTDKKYAKDLALIMQRINKLEATVLQNTLGNGEYLVGKDLAKESLLVSGIKNVVNFQTDAKNLYRNIEKGIYNKKDELFKSLKRKDDGKKKLIKDIEEMMKTLILSSPNKKNIEEIINNIILKNAKKINYNLQELYNLKTIFFRDNNDGKKLLKAINKKLVLLYEDDIRLSLIKYTVENLYNELNTIIQKISTENIDACNPTELGEGSVVKFNEDIQLYNNGQTFIVNSIYNETNNMLRVSSIINDSNYCEFDLQRDNVVCLKYKGTELTKDSDTFKFSKDKEGTVVKHKEGEDNIFVKYSEDSVVSLKLKDLSFTKIQIGSIVKIISSFVNKEYSQGKVKSGNKINGVVKYIVEINAGLEYEVNASEIIYEKNMNVTVNYGKYQGTKGSIDSTNQDNIIVNVKSTAGIAQPGLNCNQIILDPHTMVIMKPRMFDVSDTEYKVINHFDAINIIQLQDPTTREIINVNMSDIENIQIVKLLPDSIVKLKKDFEKFYTKGEDYTVIKVNNVVKSVKINGIIIKRFDNSEINVNGIFERTSEVCNERAVYKHTNNNYAMWYFNFEGKFSWCVGNMQEKCSEQVYAHVESDVVNPEEAGNIPWKVYSYANKAHEVQNGINIVSLGDKQLLTVKKDGEMFIVDNNILKYEIERGNDVKIIGNKLTKTANKQGIVKNIYDPFLNKTTNKIKLEELNNEINKYVIRVEYTEDDKKNIVRMLYYKGAFELISTTFDVSKDLQNKYKLLQDINTANINKEEINTFIELLKKDFGNLYQSILTRTKCIENRKTYLEKNPLQATPKEKADCQKRILLLKEEGTSKCDNLISKLENYLQKSFPDYDLDYLDDIINSLYPDHNKLLVVKKIILHLLNDSSMIKADVHKVQFLTEQEELIKKLYLIQKEQGDINDIINSFQKHKEALQDKQKEEPYIYYIDIIINKLTALFTYDNADISLSIPNNYIGMNVHVYEKGSLSQDEKKIIGISTNDDTIDKKYNFGIILCEIAQDNGSKTKINFIDIEKADAQIGGAPPIDDDRLKSLYLNNDLYDNDNNDDNAKLNKLIELQKESKNGKIKTKNKIEQLSNDIDYYNKLDPQSQNDTDLMIQQINNFENDPNNPIEELALTFDDRLVFIIATFFIRYITIMLVQWCIDINIIKTFYEGFIYYAVIYIIIFWFIVLFINVDNSYDVNYMNFNGIINSIRTLFYYFYMGTNGISRLLIHTSLIIILIIVPILLNIKNKVEYVDEEENENIKLLNNEERKQLSRALSLFTMFIWLFTSIIATKF